MVVQVPMSNAVKSFTMSMDRGFLGGPKNIRTNKTIISTISTITSITLSTISGPTKPSVVPSNPNMEFNR